MMKPCPGASRTSLLVLGLAVALAGCGGSRSRPDNGAQAREGRAAGESLVCFFSQDPFPAAPLLAEDFHLWVTAKVHGLHGQKSCPAPPSSPLSAASRAAAATVVLNYAASNRARFSVPGHASVLAYLKAHGVR